MNSLRLLRPCLRALAVQRSVAVAAPRLVTRLPVAAASKMPTVSCARCYSVDLSDKSAVEAKVLEVLKAFDRVEADQCTLGAHFVNDLGLDSLDAVEIVIALEEEFGIEISDADAEKIFSAQDAVEFLTK